MIKSFADRHTQELYACGGSRRVPADVARRAARKLEYIDLATRLDGLRICFRFVDGDAYDVEFCDYH